MSPGGTRKDPKSAPARKPVRAAKPKTDAGAATYVYCITESGPAPLGSVTGLEGMGPPRFLEVEPRLWIVVSSAPVAVYGAEAIERGLGDLDWVSARALAHAAVIQAAQGKGTVIPLKIFTLFHDDARAIAHVRSRSKTFRSRLRRVRGAEEWSVRVSRGREAGAEPLARKRTEAATGTGFLLAKKAKQDEVKDRARKGRESALARRARDSRVQPLPPGAAGSSLLLDSVHLVETAERKAFLAETSRLAAVLGRDGLEVAVLGPWPPYNFVGDAR